MILSGRLLMDSEIKELRAQNKKLKEKIREQFQVFQEERNKLKSRNQVLRTQLYSQQARNKAAIEQFSAKIQALEEKIASKQQYVQFPQFRTRQISSSGKTSRFQDLEERGRRLEREADEILLKCRSGDPNVFLPPPDIYQIPTYNQAFDYDRMQQDNTTTSKSKSNSNNKSRNTRSQPVDQQSYRSNHSNIRDFDGIRSSSGNNNHSVSSGSDNGDVSNDSMIIDSMSPHSNHSKDSANSRRSISQKSAPMQQKVEMPIKRSSSSPQASKSTEPKTQKSSGSKKSEPVKEKFSAELSSVSLGDWEQQGKKDEPDQIIPQEKKSSSDQKASTKSEQKKSNSSSSQPQPEKPKPISNQPSTEDPFASSFHEDQKEEPPQETAKNDDNNNFVVAEENQSDDDSFARDPFADIDSSPAVKEEFDSKPKAPNVSPIVSEASGGKSSQKQNSGSNQDNLDVFDDSFDSNFGSTFDIDL